MYYIIHSKHASKIIIASLFKKLLLKIEAFLDQGFANCLNS